MEPWRPEASDPWELELQAVVSHLMWVLGTSPGPLQEQPVFFITQPPLQPLNKEYFKYKMASSRLDIMGQAVI